MSDESLAARHHGDLIDRALTTRVAALEKLLRDAPIASKYHGAHGFEDTRFLDDYEDWRGLCRAALGT